MNNAIDIEEDSEMTEPFVEAANPEDSWLGYSQADASQ